MLTLPNLLSLMRLPLALLFLSQSVPLRLLSITLAAASDFLDGYVARSCRQTSRLGTILDPLTDKIFVMSALFVFYLEDKIGPFEVTAMLCRDISVIIFGLYLIASGLFKQYHYRSIWSGKLMTSLQLAALLGLALNLPIPPAFYSAFLVLGLAALIELYLSDYSFIPQELRKQ